MPSLTDIRRRLGLPDTAAKWYERWEAVGAPEHPVPVPQAAEIETLLVQRLSVDPVDAAAAATARPDPSTDPELWWVIERCYRQLLDDMGGTAMMLWPQLPGKWGAAGRFVYLYALLAALPETFAYNRGRDIDDDVTWASLSNLAEKLRLNRSRHGVPGLEVAHWFTLHFRGGLYQLGRLEFTAEPAGRDGSIPGRGVDDLVLGIHIPQDGGPMTPDACAASIAWAREFFPRHFPDRFGPRPVFVCSSWLLDPRLAEHLRPDSNIVQFQKLFTLTPAKAAATDDGEKDVLRFVFDVVGTSDPASLPRDSSLRRVLADGLADGTGWQVRTGWFG